MCFLHFLLMCSVVLLLCVLGNKNCADLVVQECAYVLLLLIQFTLTNLACLNTCLTKNAAVYTQRRRQATMIWGDYRRCTICCFNCLTTKLQKTSRPFISADKKIFRMIIFNFWLNMNDLNLPWWTQSQYSSALVFQGHDLVVQNVTKTSKVVQVMLLSESQEQKKKKKAWLGSELCEPARVLGLHGMVASSPFIKTSYLNWLPPKLSQRPKMGKRICCNGYQTIIHLQCQSCLIQAETRLAIMFFSATKMIRGF